ncbi:MAG: hypothetical protein J6O73_07225 [Lachnospiraceae bacterium]|nr:hypothetical protein [Lachnospiraceae bacterium]
MKRRHVALIASTLLALSLLAGCGQDAEDARNTIDMDLYPDGIGPNLEPSEASEVPTEAPEATESIKATEEPTPTEAPTPTKSSYMVDGYDFAEFYESGASVDEVVQNWTEDSVRVIVKARNKNIEAVLKDGDSFVMDESVGAYYSFAIYVPKKAANATTTADKSLMRIYKTELENAENREKMPYVFNIDDDITGTDLECPITITYEDGTEETITIYITKEYVAKF